MDYVVIWAMFRYDDIWTRLGLYVRLGLPKNPEKYLTFFVERGGNFIDTANIYQMGTSEKHVGEFIADKRENFVVLQNTLYQPILTTPMQVEIIVRI